MRPYVLCSALLLPWLVPATAHFVGPSPFCQSGDVMRDWVAPGFFGESLPGGEPLHLTNLIFPVDGSIDCAYSDLCVDLDGDGWGETCFEIDSPDDKDGIPEFGVGGAYFPYGQHACTFALLHEVGTFPVRVYAGIDGDDDWVIDLDTPYDSLSYPVEAPVGEWVEIAAPDATLVACGDASALVMVAVEGFASGTVSAYGHAVAT